VSCNHIGKACSRNKALLAAAHAYAHIHLGLRGTHTIFEGADAATVHFAFADYNRQAEM
jgi:formamidopyrimidine-DNA glycosylase